MKGKNKEEAGRGKTSRGIECLSRQCVLQYGNTDIAEFSISDISSCNR